MTRQDEVNTSLKSKIAAGTPEEVDAEEYMQFVDNNVSGCGRDVDQLVSRMRELEDVHGINPSTFLISAIGMSGESGEALDVVKKVVFHGKPWTPELRTHMIKELGDIYWYWVAMCITLGTTPAEVQTQNVIKLAARYPEGYFTEARAENRNDTGT